MMLFEESKIETYTENLYKVTKQEKTLANYIEISSMSEREKQFAEDCESNENVGFYFKMPHWFTIKTPIGDYNPDWALIFKNEKKLYFVAETKGSLDRADLRIGEELKIKCGEAHFKEFDNVEYKVVTKLEELV